MANDLGNPLGGAASFNSPINSVAKVRSCKTEILHGIAWHCNSIFCNFLDQCGTDRKTNGTLLKTGGETLKERKPLSKIDRHSCRRLRRFLILESCNAYISSICSMYILVAVGSSGILKGKQKLGVTFNSDKLGGIDFTKFSKLSMCSAGAGRYWLVLVKVYV